MLRKSTSPVAMNFTRAGGTIILAQVDIWQAGPTDWVLIASQQFKLATQTIETVSLKLLKGSYTCVFQCFVQESLNGRYRFSLDVAGSPTFADSGDVNTTPAKDDTKVFKDQFILEVA